MISSQDIFLVLFLVLLEGILSIDNALVLALLAKELPPAQQRKALTYGLVGAIAFRLLSLTLIMQVLHWHWVKFIGGGYLVLIAVKYLIRSDEKKKKHRPSSSFWKTVFMIELTDIAFALDSILAAIALTPKFWIVFTGGLLGVILMRLAANWMIKIIHKLPHLELTAYVLVLIIGLKVILEGLMLPLLDFDHPNHWAFWAFWGLMFITITLGFRPRRSKKTLVST